jgi:hypothetical protein
LSVSSRNLIAHASAYLSLAEVNRCSLAVAKYLHLDVMRFRIVALDEDSRVLE